MRIATAWRPPFVYGVRDTRSTVYVNNRDKIKVQKALRACEISKCSQEEIYVGKVEGETTPFMDLIWDEYMNNAEEFIVNKKKLKTVLHSLALLQL